MYEFGLDLRLELINGFNPRSPDSKPMRVQLPGKPAAVNAILPLDEHAQFTAEVYTDECLQIATVS